MRRYIATIVIALAIGQLGVTAALAAGAGRNDLAGDALIQATPAMHYIWTDKLWYLKGETVTLRWNTDPMGDPYPFVVVVYLENIQTGARQYVANNRLTQTPTDAFGNSLDNPAPTALPVMTPPAATGTPQPWGMQLLSSSIPTANIGNYHFVAELRDVTGTQVIKSAFAKFNVVSEEVRLGWNKTDTEISSDTTWTSDKVYRLQYQVFVNEGVTLTIEPGTIVVAAGQNAILIVERGGKIIADGRRELPIVMTCDGRFLASQQDPPVDGDIGFRAAGCWGGLITLGRATNNIQPVPGNECLTCVGTGLGLAEGVIPATRPVYGGTDDSDSSGVYRFLRVEFAGVDFSDDVQPNAFGFHSAGSGTVLDYLQAHYAEDDGFEFFGGTANLKHFVVSGAKDDHLDATFGWRGKVQFGFIIAHHKLGENGWEYDGNEFGHTNQPLSNVKIYNISWISNADSQDDAKGIYIRRGAAMQLANSYVSSFNEWGFRAKDDATFALMNNGTTSLRDVTFYNNALGAPGDSQLHADSRAWMATQEGILYDLDPMPRNVRFEPNPDPRPREGSHVVLVQNSVTPPSDGFFDTSARYRGAFDTESLWIKEWTWFGDEEDFVVPAALQ